MAHSAQIYELDAMTVFTAGQFAKSQIFSGLRTGYFIVTLAGALTTAGPITDIFNNGSLAALFTLLSVQENNDDVVLWDPRLSVGLTSAIAAGDGANVRLNTLTPGTYNLREQIVIPFAWPLSGNEWETSFVEKNPQAPTYVRLQPWGGYNPANAAGLAPILAGGTASLANLTVTIEQIADKNQVAYPPIFRPRFTQIINSVSAANAQLRTLLTTSAPQRGVLFMQDTNVGMVNDIVNTYRILSDYQGIDAPNFVNYDRMARYQRQIFGGNVFQYGGIGVDPAGGSMLFRNWQSGGRLSEIIVPDVMGQNFRIETNCQPSVTAGATSSNLVAGIISLEKVANVTLTGTDGKFAY
jgi:hypothetical protein